MKNKFTSVYFYYVLPYAIFAAFALPTAAQVKRWAPLPAELNEQSIKDSARIETIAPKASFDDILRLKNSLESDWKPKNKMVYLDLLLKLGSKAGWWSNLGREKEDELMKLFNAFYLHEFDSMTASQKVLAAMYFSTGREAKLLYNEPVSQRLDLFLKAEMALEEQKTTAENLPIPEKIDLSKYDWSKQRVFFSGMSAAAFDDPELRRVWQSVLDRESIIRRKSSIKSEVLRSGKILSIIAETFINRLDLSSDESKSDVKKKLDAPELKKLKGGVVASLLEAKLKGAVKSDAP